MNNRSLNVIKAIYKPYCYTKKGKVIILKSTENIVVVKDSSTNNIFELFTYLLSRKFTNIPVIIDKSRKDVIIYEYIEDIEYPKEQKALDLITIVANLHQKTNFYKDVTEDNFKAIYDMIQNNIIYYQEYYENFFNKALYEEYMSPSTYLFTKNYSKIISCLLFCQQELDNWYELVKKTDKTRVSIIHNNLSLNHHLKNQKDYLISWDKSTIDTPILDLVVFYHQEYFNLNFEPILQTYNKLFPLTKEEQKLFFILISLPLQLQFNNNEFENTIKVRYFLDYLYKTEKLVRPYYLKDQEEKK